MLGFSTYAALLPELRDLWRLSNSEAGMVSGAFFAGYIGTVSLWTALTDRMDARKVYLGGSLLAAAGGAGFGLFQVANNRNMFLSAPPARSAASGGIQGTARLTGQTAGTLLVAQIFLLMPAHSAPQIAVGFGAAFTLAAGIVSLLRTTAS